MTNTDTTVWMICACQDCRDRQWREAIAAIRFSHHWEMTFFPSLPFPWPTNQKAICS